MRLTLILNGDGSWTKVKVSYFCSNRNDMWAGSYIYDLFSLTELYTSVSQQFSIRFANWPERSGDYKVNAQIAGIKATWVNPNTPSIKLYDSTFDPSTGTTTFRFSFTINMQVLL